MLPYSSPTDNPFCRESVGGRDEIYALGMRNPWRFSFDRGTGQQWVGDVGQSTREEVDAPILNGGNYGWRVFEGTFCTGNDPGLCNSVGLCIPPVLEYDHSPQRTLRRDRRIRLSRDCRMLSRRAVYLRRLLFRGDLSWNGTDQTHASRYGDEHLVVR